MIRDGEPYVLEYNVRMGDPECQPITMRMDFDLYDYFVASADGKLSSMPKSLGRINIAVCVVLAQKVILNLIQRMKRLLGLILVPDDAFVFHAGTKQTWKRFFQMVDVFWELLH